MRKKVGRRNPLKKHFSCGEVNKALKVNSLRFGQYVKVATYPLHPKAVPESN